ncbi:transcriptional regulator [Croceicoccus ponticola]|uniref:Transcriptional regulator n=1 Tax=Croceicoccus ponticola TaxID=2217664 RepID=A0A437GZ73_9SPHN|nr:transcriptional regulator [Croceicoccus ponticola]
MASRDREAEAELLRAIAHGTRLQILSALRDAERAVGEIEAMTGIAQPGLSQQLGVLRKAELVATRREGKQVFYAIAAPRLGEALAVIDGLMPVSAAPATSKPEPATGGEAQVAADRRDPIRRRGGAAVFARITD